jgi:hypothetical protein
MGAGKGKNRRAQSLLTQMTPRFAVVAEVNDAAEFDEKIREAPLDIAPGYDLSKAPTEETIEFYVEAESEEEAIRQFNEALTFVGQTAKSIEVHDA